MPGKKAKILSDAQAERLLAYTGLTRYPERNQVMVLLSVKAGLRAGEIAALTWEMVLEPGGTVGNLIELHDRAAKKKSGRAIPIHADLRETLTIWKALTVPQGAIIRSERGKPMQPVSIVHARKPIEFSTSTAARRIPGAAHLSPGQRGWCTRPVVRCATFNCWPATGRS